MRTRTTRAVLLALLLLALPPGASLAAGLSAEAGSCCCAHGTASPEVQATSDAPSCCKVSQGSSLPPSAPATVEAAHVAPAAGLHAVVPASSAPPAARAALPQVDREIGRRPPPDLFILHAAFLI